MAESLVVELREGAGKQVARKLRAAGRIPAVLYGRGRTSVSLTLDPHRLERALAESSAGLNTLFDLEVPGNGEYSGRVVMLKEIQRDPLQGQLLHADLYEVNLAETVQVSVPLHEVGVAQGVTLGGILDHSLRELEIECMPQAIPERIELSVGHLEIGQSIHVRELSLPEGVTLRTDPNLAVVSVIAPAKEEVPAEAEEAAEVAAEGEEATPTEPPAAEQPSEESGD